MPKKLLLVLSVCCFIAVSTVLIYFLVRPSPTKDERKVVFESESHLPKSEELVRIPKDAKSEVCTKLPAKTVEAIANIKTTGARVSIPTTTTKTGSVSACTYIAADEKENIRSIVITSRVFNTADDARKAYQQVDGGHSGDSFLNDSKTQLTVIKDNKLSTITILRASKDKQFDEQIFFSLADKL